MNILQRYREPVMRNATWKDQPCYYVSVGDAGRTALVLGPFKDEAECRAWAYSAPEDAGDASKHALLMKVAECDPRSWFYYWGMVKFPNGHQDGVLNSRVADVQGVPL